MVDALGSALSGLMLNSRKLDAAASNIANAQSNASLGKPEAAYQPVDVEGATNADGTVRVVESTRDPATVAAYDPSSANANSEGMVAMPNVSLEEELINQKMATIGYKANANAIHALAAMDKSLLDIKT